VQTTFGSALTDTPFRLHVEPSEAVAHPGWRQARAEALAALGRGEVVALLGLPGTGKTLLLRDMVQRLRHEGRSVHFVESGDALNPGSGTDVLLIDEAERMDADALVRLCATATPFVLAALPSFKERLAGLPRPLTAVALQPLPAEEVARFIAARLAAAGRRRDMLEPDAVLALARHSGGLLRLVNVLGGAALFLAERQQAPRVARRHVDEAAAMRDGEGAIDLVLPSPEPTAPATSGADAPRAAHVPFPALWRRRAALGAAAVASLGLVLAGRWALSWRPPVPPPEMRISTGNGADGNLRGNVGGQPPRVQTDDSHLAESPHDDAGLARGQEPAIPQQAAPTSPPSRASSTLRQRPALSAAAVSFRGPVYNETLRQGGQMSLVITRQGPPGAITARFEAWGGLLGTGELAGHLSKDGHLRASGQLMVGKNPFVCDLNGFISGGTLTGSASFLHSSNGRVAYSHFTLSRR
jgi:hypothetical protein